MRASTEILKKLTPRYYAQYITSRGTVASKGYCTKKLAARHSAKEWLLDQIHGEKEYVSTPCGEFGWYQRDWDLERMKWVFNCQWIAENGILDHRARYCGFDGMESDEIFCTDDGKAFCAMAWTYEVRRIAGLILSGDDLFMSWWVIERLGSYVRPCDIGQTELDMAMEATS